MPPQVGGENNLGTTLTAWTGGSNVAARQNARPKSIKCYRPEDFKSASSIEAKLEEEFPEDRCLKSTEEMDDDPKAISLTLWLTEVQRALEERGMDTVFRLFNPNTDSELYMLT